MLVLPFDVDLEQMDFVHMDETHDGGYCFEFTAANSLVFVADTPGMELGVAWRVPLPSAVKREDLHADRTGTTTQSQ